MAALKPEVCRDVISERRICSMNNSIYFPVFIFDIFSVCDLPINNLLKM